jgi:hypothetical protein
MLRWRRTIENTTNTFIERALRVLRKDHTTGSVREGMCVRSDTCRARSLRVTEGGGGIAKRNISEASRRENDDVIRVTISAEVPVSRRRLAHTWSKREDVTYQFASATLVTSLKGQTGCQSTGKWRRDSEA